MRHLTLTFLLFLYLFVSIVFSDLTHSSFPICTDSEAQQYPAISGNVVVWSDSRNDFGDGTKLDIYGYDLNTSTEFHIASDPVALAMPAISGNIVVWYSYRNGNADIYGYDLSTSTEFPICTDSAHQRYPAISENIVVWEDGRLFNDDLFGGFAVWCNNKPQGDANDDCVVDIVDFSIMASEWLDCGWSDPSVCL